MRRWWVPALPFLLSLALSAATVGRSVGWQDSGFFLFGVREMALLHPPGFVLYLLLCKAWTWLFFFLDFTLGVHLFSSACAAAAAATLAVTARDAFKTSDRAAALAGCLLAAGYTFWASAIYAKGYALYFLVIALLLRQIARADESRSPRDFTIAAALSGIAWAAHPAATLLAPALLLFAWHHRRTLGGKGLAWRAALGAGCALGPSLLLPVLAAGDLFGGIGSFGEFVRYLRGGRYTDAPGVFGLAPSRWISAGLFTWEEFLGVGVAMAILGGLGIDRRRALWIAAWSAPVAAFALLFKIEGQLDFWLLPAWMPLQLLIAPGLLRAERLRRGALPVLGAAGLLWALAANGPDVAQRKNDLPATFGRLFLGTVTPGSVLIVGSDDALGSCLWLQGVNGERTDVALVNAARVDLPKAVDLWVLRGRPIFFEFAPPPGKLPAGFTTEPAGALEKLMKKGEEHFEPAFWDFPLKARDVRARFRRARGQKVTFLPGDVVVEPEPYERRLFDALLRADEHLGHAHMLARTTEGYRKAAETFESLLETEPSMERSLETCYPLALAYLNLGRPDRAEPFFRKTLTLSPAPRVEAGAAHFLSQICERTGRIAEARALGARAGAILQADPTLRAGFEDRVRSMH
jgi:tetratricopeptide (TPR) repeat protein